MKSRLLLLIAALFVVGYTEPPTQPKLLDPEEAAKQGSALVAELLSQVPAQNTTNTGVLKIRDATRRNTDVPVKFEIVATDTNWWNYYETVTSDVTIVHSDVRPNVYVVRTNGENQTSLTGNETMVPFAGSDFWIADLGLEFLHWPEQHLVKKAMRRGQSCNVLESINPSPTASAYSRVVSWIDIDTGGIINADAYDSKNKLLKEFAANRFKKVHGQWELQEIEMENRQTGSDTKIQFDVGVK